MGGTFSTARKANVDQISSNGAFNLNSLMITVVVAFDNKGSNPWGTGGTLTVDNLLLTNDDQTGSGWFAGLYWDGLLLDSNGCLDANHVYVGADIKGDTPGGDYLLRVEGNLVTQAGFDEDFDDVTQTGGGVFLDSNAVAAGTSFNSIGNWDDGVSGETAFGGLVGDAAPYESFPPFFIFGVNAGFRAECVATGGNPDGFGRLAVEEIEVPAGGDGMPELRSPIMVWHRRTLAKSR